MTRRFNRFASLIVSALLIAGLFTCAIAEDGAVIVEEFTAGLTDQEEPNEDYAADDPSTAAVSGVTQIVVTAGGDCTLGSTEAQRRADGSFDDIVSEKGYGWPFSGLIDLLDTDDLTLVNFEGTLTESTDRVQKQFNFKGPADFIEILKLGSVEAVNLANNHILDYGADGKADTIAALDAAGITYCASKQTAVFESQGIKIGLIGNVFPYSNGKCDISASVKSLREQGCAIVIASFHWGSEYEANFSAEQRNIGRAAINAGADVVIGHHPHIVQGIELYKGKYILYSLGNFVFGGNINPDDRDSFLARLTFVVRDGVAEPPALEMIPVKVTELAKGTDFRPVPAVGSEAERIRDRVLKRSYKLDALQIFGMD